MAPFEEPDYMSRDQDRQQNDTQDRQKSSSENPRDDIAEQAALGWLRGREDLKSRVEHRMREIPLHFPLRSDRYRCDPQLRLLGLNGFEQISHRGLDYKIILYIHLLADFLPEVDAKAGEPALFLEDKRLDEPRRYAQFGLRYLSLRW